MVSALKIFIFAVVGFVHVSGDHEDSEVLFLNEGSDLYMKIRTKAGLEFTDSISVSQRMNKSGAHEGLKITGLAFDVRTQNLYISDKGEPAIVSVGVNSLDWRYLVNSDIPSPMDVAFDWYSNNLYWVDSEKGTAEVVNVDSLRRTVVVSGLTGPISIAVSPNTDTMYIATTGVGFHIYVHRMDGRFRTILDVVQGSSASLAVHPTKPLVYWTDPGEGTISYIDWWSSRGRKILKKNLDGVMAVTVTERDFYFTSGELTSERAHRIKNPGCEKDEGWKSITYGIQPSGKSKCLVENGGCDFLCLTSERGRSCACAPQKTLAKNGRRCLAGPAPAINKPWDGIGNDI